MGRRWLDNKQIWPSSTMTHGTLRRGQSRGARVCSAWMVPGRNSWQIQWVHDQRCKPPPDGGHMTRWIEGRLDHRAWNKHLPAVGDQQLEDRYLNWLSENTRSPKHIVLTRSNNLPSHKSPEPIHTQCDHITCSLIHLPSHFNITMTMTTSDSDDGSITSDDVASMSRIGMFQVQYHFVRDKVDETIQGGHDEMQVKTRATWSIRYPYQYMYLQREESFVSPIQVLSGEEDREERANQIIKCTVVRYSSAEGVSNSRKWLQYGCTDQNTEFNITQIQWNIPILSPPTHRTRLTTNVTRVLSHRLHISVQRSSRTITKQRTVKYIKIHNKGNQIRIKNSVFQCLVQRMPNQKVTLYRGCVKIKLHPIEGRI